MSRSYEDNIEDEVRRRLRTALTEAGVPSDQANTEVLYMLPAEFIRGYRKLFDEALSWSPQGLETKDQGRIKARGVGAKGGGKRFRNGGAYGVKSELAGEAKRKLDRKLIRAIRTALEEAHQSKEDGANKTKAIDNQPETR